MATRKATEHEVNEAIARLAEVKAGLEKARERRTAAVRAEVVLEAERKRLGRVVAGRVEVTSDG